MACCFMDGKVGNVRTLSRSLIVGMALAVPAVAFAQSSDAKYCKTLTDLSRSPAMGGTERPLAVSAAISRCEAGDYSGIPVLEHYLTDSKATLPRK
jgi:hypothetical protein